MRQRALIAMALACSPRLLIADEPTTALDVTIQAQILELLRELVVDSGTALVMITHDLGVVAGLCDRVHVMYAGKIIETADRHDLFARPRQPYTGGLLASVPRLDSGRGHAAAPRSAARPATPSRGREGCAFAPALRQRAGRLPHRGVGQRRPAGVRRARAASCAAATRCTYPPAPSGATALGAAR